MFIVHTDSTAKTATLTFDIDAAEEFTALERELKDGKDVDVCGKEFKQALLRKFVNCLFRKSALIQRTDADRQTELSAIQARHDEESKETPKIDVSNVVGVVAITVAAQVAQEKKAAEDAAKAEAALAGENK